MSLEPVPRRFHARHDAVARSYLYQISRRRTAFAKAFVWWIKEDLGIETLRQAGARFAGMKDFRSFTDDTTDEKSTLVAIERVEVAEDGDLVLIRIEGSHFLWKMVRRIVGVMADVARGGTSLTDLDGYLREASNVPARLTAPAAGLFLERVYYAGDRRKPPLRGLVGRAVPR